MHDEKTSVFTFFCLHKRRILRRITRKQGYGYTAIFLAVKAAIFLPFHNFVQNIKRWYTLEPKAIFCDCTVGFVSEFPLIEAVLTCIHNIRFEQKKMKIVKNIKLKTVIFTAVKYCSILHGHVCVM